LKISPVALSKKNEKIGTELKGEITGWKQLDRPPYLSLSEDGFDAFMLMVLICPPQEGRA